MKAARIAGLAAGLALVTSPAAALAAQSTPAAPQTTDVGNTMQEYSQQAAALVKVHNVTGTFAFNQEAQTANDVIQSIFRKAAASLCSTLPVYQGVADDAAIAVGGDIAAPFNANLTELSQAGKAQHHVMTCPCTANSVGGKAIATTEVEGVPIETLAALAGLGE